MRDDRRPGRSPTPAAEEDNDRGFQLSLEARFRAPRAAEPGPDPDPEEPEPPPAPPPQSPSPSPAPRVYTVSDLVRAARATLEARFAEILVEGEISGLKRSGPGHFYFCLKDELAQMDAVMFSREVGRLKFRPEDGLVVRCRGRLTIYESRGRFQLTVGHMEPTGAGALAFAFEQLKQKLGAEGLFDPGRKRPLPFLPRRLGVVTSRTGAVIRDIVRVAHRRFPIPILLAPTPVQGEGAAASIGAALRAMSAVKDVDVIILARGGGSLEDLWAFNEEPVARALAGCRVPVISAVGHETDVTIADFVADVRAPTPSAAAELAVPVAEDLRGGLGDLRRRLGRAADGRLHRVRLELERARGRLGDPRRLFDIRRQAVDELSGRAARAVAGRITRGRAALRQVEIALHRAHPSQHIAEQRAALVGLRHRLDAVATAALTGRRAKLAAAAGKLDALSPLRVLERGYSVTRLRDGSVVTRATQVRGGDSVRLTLREGELDARIEGVHPPSREKP